MKSLIVSMIVIVIILFFVGCPALFKPLEIEDMMHNDGELVFFDLRDFTSARDIDTVVYEVVAGVGTIHGDNYYRWIADFHKEGGLSGVFEVTIRATNSRAACRRKTLSESL